jgi:hypothetical protein
MKSISEGPEHVANTISKNNKKTSTAGNTYCMNISSEAFNSSDNWVFASPMK